MRKLLAATIGSFLIVASLPLNTFAQENLAAERLGLSCQRILAMKAGKWGEYYTQKKGFSEVDLNIAFNVFADCHRQRNDAASRKLSTNTRQRIQKYRQLYQNYRISSQYLAAAYAGGGTMYSHMANRGIILDEEMVEKIINIHLRQKSAPTGINTNLQNRINQIQKELATNNPKAPQNNAKFFNENSRKLGNQEYNKMQATLKEIVALLKTERRDVSQEILKFVADTTNPYKE